jgi:hypothetical protein
MGLFMFSLFSIRQLETKSFLVDEINQAIDLIQHGLEDKPATEIITFQKFLALCNMLVMADNPTIAMWQADDDAYLKDILSEQSITKIADIAEKYQLTITDTTKATKAVQALQQIIHKLHGEAQCMPYHYRFV